MDMAGEQLIAATKDEVWTALNDPEVLKVCIPGCQELTKSSDTEMSAVAVMKVGPVKARFQGAVTLSDLDPPNGYKITGEGQGGVAGFAKGIATVRLEAAEGGGTLLRYSVEAQIGGKLSQLGGRLIDVTAKQMSGQFFKRFAEEIQARQNHAAATDTATVSSASTGAVSASSEVHSAVQPLQASVSPRPSISPQNSPATERTTGLLSLAATVFLAVLAAMWLVYGGILPSLAPMVDAPSHISPDLASIVQLIMASAIGYLFGVRVNNR